MDEKKLNELLEKLGPDPPFGWLAALAYLIISTAVSTLFVSSTDIKDKLANAFTPGDIPLRLGYQLLVAGRMTEEQFLRIDPINALPVQQRNILIEAARSAKRDVENAKNQRMMDKLITRLDKEIDERTELEQEITLLPAKGLETEIKNLREDTDKTYLSMLKVVVDGEINKLNLEKEIEESELKALEKKIEAMA